MINVSPSKTLYCGAVVASLFVGCGKAKKEVVYVNQPQTTANQTTGNQVSTDPAKTSDALAVEIKNFSTISNQSIQNGSQIEFGLKNSSGQISGVSYKCSLDRAGSTGTSLAQDCASPYQVKAPADGQYTFTVYASHASSSSISNLSQVTFSIGNGYGSGQPGNGGISVGGTSIGGSVGPQSIQVGDLFMVTVPVGMHMVYRASTHEYTGYQKFKMIDRRMDNAAPFPLNCGQNMEMQVTEMSPAGRALNYCEMTPSISYNAEGSPYNNQYRFITMNTMSYNSLQIASDSTLVQAANSPQHAGPSELSKLSINVFTNPNLQNRPANNQWQAQFATEFSQTVSLLQITCGGQNIQYMGNAASFQGYFNWSVAVSPLFGCVYPRNGKYFVSVGTFPMDRVGQYVPGPQCDWNCWSAQNFGNVRAAEIVVEMGPFSYPPATVGLAPQAQGLMLQNIKKLTP